MISWSIWYRRNRLRLQQPADNNFQLVKRARESLTEFQEAQDRDLHLPQQPGSAESVKWNPLAQGSYKVNYDGAVFSDSNAAGIGEIGRAHV